MKSFKIFVFAVLGVVSAISFSHAQDYKHPYGMVKEDGKVLSPDGKHIGWVTKDGIIKDTMGVKIAQMDAEGTLVDSKTGKKLGKAQKNGNFTPSNSKTPDEKWSVGEPMNGSCEVKDKSGKTVVLVHENYKQYGACAYHCLTMKKEHKDMKMK